MSRTGGARGDGIYRDISRDRRLAGARRRDAWRGSGVSMPTPRVSLDTLILDFTYHFKAHGLLHQPALFVGVINKKEEDSRTHVEAEREAWRGSGVWMPTPRVRVYLPQCMEQMVEKVNSPTKSSTYC